MPETIRGLVRKKISEIRDNIKTLSPGELSEELVYLSSLYASWAENLTVLEQAYSQKKLEFLNSSGEKKVSVAEAELLASTTPEAKEYFEARRLEKALVELLRSIKFRLKVMGSDWEFSHNQ